MKLAGAFDHHAAVVVVGVDLLALALGRDHARARFSSLVIGRHLLRHLGIVPGCEGADKATAKMPVTLDALALDHGLDLLERFARIVQHG